jgi:hypothetical protein
MDAGSGGAVTTILEEDVRNIRGRKIIHPAPPFGAKRGTFVFLTTFF